jgi:hypothetical protein
LTEELDFLKKKVDAMMPDRKPVPEISDEVHIGKFSVPEALPFVRQLNIMPTTPAIGFEIDTNGDLIYYSDEYPGGTNIGHVSGDGLDAYNPTFEIIGGNLYLTDPGHPSGVDLGAVSGTDGEDGVDGVRGPMGPPGNDADVTDVINRVDVYTRPVLQGMVDEAADMLKKLLLVEKERLRQEIISFLLPILNKPQPVFRVYEVGDEYHIQVSYNNMVTWIDIDIDITGPQGEKGDTGDPHPEPEFYVDPTTYKLNYRYPGDAEWTAIETSIRGPQGAEGEQGDTGSTGATGPQGPAGPKGDKGDTGASAPVYKYYYCQT